MAQKYSHDYCFIFSTSRIYCVIIYVIITINQYFDISIWTFFLINFFVLGVFTQAINLIRNQDNLLFVMRAGKEMIILEHLIRYKLNFFFTLAMNRIRSQKCIDDNKDSEMGCPHGVMVQTMDCGIVVSEFKLQSCYNVHFQTNTLGKGMNSLILPVMG